MDVFDLAAKITLDSSNYTSGLDSASQKTTSFADKIKGGLKGAAKIGGAALGTLATEAGAVVTAMIKGVSETAKYGDNIDKMSQKLGFSTTAYQEWDAILQHSGTSIESMQGAMKTLQVAAENGSDAFTELGMSQEEIANMNPEQLWESTIKALQNVDDETKRTALATKLLGKGGTELGALLNTSAEDVEAMRDRVHELGGVMSEDAVKAAAAYQDSLQDMKTAFKGLSRSLTSQFMPSITKVRDGLTEIFAGNGDKGIAMVSEGIDEFISTITEKVPEIIDTGASIVSALLDALVENLPKLLEMGGTVLGKLISGIIKKLPALIKAAPKIIKAVVNGIKNAISAIVDAGKEIVDSMKDGFAEKLDDVKGWGADLIDKIKSGITENWEKLKDAVSEKMDLVKDAISEKWETVKETVSTAIDNIKAAAEEKWNAIKDAIGTVIDTVKSDVEERWNSVKEAVDTAIDNIKTGAEEKWEEVKTAVIDKVTEIKTDVLLAWTTLKAGVISRVNTLKTSVTNAWTTVKTNVGTTIDTIKTDAETKWEEVKTGITSKVNALKTGLVASFNSIKSSAATIWNNVKTTITKAINSAKTTVGNAIDAIKGFFNFDFTWPKLKLPHITYDLITVPVLGQIPDPTTLRVDWYKKAYQNPYMFTKPTLMGFGDGSGGEMVYGHENLMSDIKNAVAQTSAHADVTINVYPQPNQSPSEIAQMVQKEFIRWDRQRRAAYA